MKDINPFQKWFEKAFMLCLVSAFVTFSAAVFFFYGGKLLLSFLSLAYEIIFISLVSCLMYIANVREERIREIYWTAYHEGYEAAQSDSTFNVMRKNICHNN